MSREIHVRFCEGLGVRFPRATRLLILCRTREEADRLFEAACREAEHLRLELNQSKSSRLDLREGFDFLGFHFYLDGEWKSRAAEGPRLVEDLHWQPAKKPVDARAGLLLPGESDWDTTFRQSTLVVSDAYQRIRIEGKKLVIEPSEKRAPKRIPIAKLRDLIVSDATALDWKAVRRLARQGCCIVMVDRSGRVALEVDTPERMPPATTVLAQVKIQSDEQRKLAIARELVASKLHNHAVLAEQIFKYPQATVRQLMDLSRDALATPRIEQLLGIEGAGAAIWYGRFPDALGRGFRFERRVAPDAGDPVNVMLNLGHTMLHRSIKLWIDRAGLVPTLGVLHEERAGHATLASDIQEPFRHVIDRAVIEASRDLHASDFVVDEDGPYPLRIANRARLQLVSLIQTEMTRSVAGAGQPEPVPYLYQARKLVHAFRRQLHEADQPFRSFWHPTRVSNELLGRS